ncbi:hypothetical protein ZIOFF_001525 [Zingiber officinale]|uniref:Transcription initiation factor TFIID subunit 12 domain-containing protein n=1 Tax=Zingiber officinale TaxID=94328 RepID=A0A8J5I5W8_ZINOF|nr:hypothetical protein ZIOFF_001525 [Zingiber officinale]
MEDPPPSAASSEPAPVAAASAPSEASHSNLSSSPNPAQPPPSTASSSSIAAPSTSQNPPQPQSQSIPPSQSHQPIQQHLRPPVLRNRPQSSFPHFDHQLPSPATPSISSSTSSAGPAVSASPSAPTASSQRAGLAIGVPAHSPHIRAQESSAASYPTFGASSSFTQPFSALPRMPEQPPTANAQLSVSTSCVPLDVLMVRQPIQGIQNIGMIGSLSTSSQIRPLGASGPPQQRFIQPTSRGPAFSVNQVVTQLLTNLMRRVLSTYAVPMLGLFAKDNPLLHRGVKNLKVFTLLCSIDYLVSFPKIFTLVQKFQSSNLMRGPSVISSSSMPSLSQQPLSSQGKQMPATLAPSSSFRPQMKQQTIQQRPNLPNSITSQQMVAPQQQQQQQQLQQHKQHQQMPQQMQQPHQQPQQFLQHHASSRQPQEQYSQQNLQLRNQQQLQQAARPLRPASSKANLPTLVQTNPGQSGAISAAIDTDAAESGNQVLSKRSIRELVNQIDPSEKLDSEVEDILVDIGEDFIESITTFACSLAKHRKSSTLEAKDILLHVVVDHHYCPTSDYRKIITCCHQSLTDYCEPVEDLKLLLVIIKTRPVHDGCRIWLVNNCPPLLDHGWTIVYHSQTMDGSPLDQHHPMVKPWQVFGLLSDHGQMSTTAISFLNGVGKRLNKKAGDENFNFLSSPSHRQLLVTALPLLSSPTRTYGLMVLEH